MPKLRQNIVTGEWVVIAPERAKRPEDFVMASAPKKHLDDKCPFCISNPDGAYQFSIKEAETQNIYIIPNRFPAFSSSDGLIQEGGQLYTSTKALGGHEVIILKDHQKEIYEGGWELLSELFGVYQKRLAHYEQDPTIEYAMPIHNLGPEAGASIEHPHSQFFASSVVPNLVEKELVGAKAFYEDKHQCVFCAMIEEEKRQGIRVISENEDFIAFTFFASRFPFEMWVLPKKHSPSFEAIDTQMLENLSKLVYDVVLKLNNAIKFPPFNWWIHTGPIKKDHVDDYYHWHMEIAPRVSKFGGYEMGSGIVIDVVSPELAAGFLKKA
jgi:UDPglucose--hexose-1-phosphate uridylyltransferase